MDMKTITTGRLEPAKTFSERVYALCSRVPAGKVTTYGSIAKALGKPRAARAVGQALNRNPYAPAVPCHRVVGSDGSLTGFASGMPKKKRMLKAEGVEFAGDRVAPRSIVPVN